MLLTKFVNHQKPPLHLQVWIPAIGCILNELPVNSAIPQMLLDVARWLCYHTHQVYAQFSQHTPPTPNPPSIPPSKGYLVTRVCYGLPAVWVYPKYGCLPDDSALEDKLQNLTECKASNIVCGKYYDMYQKPGLVGGLIVLWCYHSICISFHIIPTCEGWNNVFSALYTY